MVTATAQSYEGIELRRTVTDNAGREHQTRHDTLGRVVRSIENVTGDGATRGDVTGTSEPDENRTTVQQYDQAGRLATQIALSPVDGSLEVQKTRYVYDSDVDGARVTEEVYPDSEDGSQDEATGVWSLDPEDDDHIALTHDRLGRVLKRTDQRGVAITFTYDDAGRLESQSADLSEAPSAVDDEVQRIEWSYDERGRVETVTSRADATGGAIRNQVEYEYDDDEAGSWGALAETFQAHDGAVDTASTPSVGYAYDDGASGGGGGGGEAAVMRMTKTIYPSLADGTSGSRRVVHRHVPDYDSGGSADDQIAAVLGRASALSKTDDPSGSSDHYATYTYRGGGAIVAMQRPEAGDGNPLGHEPVLDSLGRVVEHEWVDDGETLDGYHYGHDAAGNRTFRENMHADAAADDLDEFYSHDGLHRLADMERGELDDTRTGIDGTPVRRQYWETVDEDEDEYRPTGPPRYVVLDHGPTVRPTEAHVARLKADAPHFTLDQNDTVGE